MSDADTVIDNAARSRFELRQDGRLARLDYLRRADQLVLVHTEVPAALGGRGIGGTLVHAAVDRASRDRLTVVPLCSFARTWLERHSEAASVVTIDWGPPPDD